MSRKPTFFQPLGITFEQSLTLIANENKPIDSSFTARPFLKWVGGKRSILPELIKRLPASYGKYHEPFLGGGALYFAIQPKHAQLSDVNFHLIITFKAVRDNVDQLIFNLKIHAKNHSKEYFLKSRKRLFKEEDPVHIAALFIYLNKTCFNGLYRVNREGRFNVPMGAYVNPAILDEENLRYASEVLKTAEISQHDFSQVKIIKNDFYYIDPPYHNTYSGYSGQGFGDKEHEKLAEFCHGVNEKGGYFMLSNSDTALVRKLYSPYNVEKVLAARSVNCKADGRNKEYELLIRNYQ
jgi:DNA adenine methylase